MILAIAIVAGKTGTIIDDAADEWDGDARHGVGDYRIPTVMLTYPNNTRMNPPVHKGEFGDRFRITIILYRTNYSL